MLTARPSTRRAEGKQPIEVRIEIDAAEYDAACDGKMAYIGQLGWNAHRIDGDLDDAGEQQAGWLARELETHDWRYKRDKYAWPWDPARPVAGQYEEWVEWITAQRITAQTRHDIAASMVRHDRIDAVRGSDGTVTRAHACGDFVEPTRIPGRVPYAEDQIELPVVSLGLVIGDEPEQGVKVKIRDRPTTNEVVEHLDKRQQDIEQCSRCGRPESLTCCDAPPSTRTAVSIDDLVTPDHEVAELAPDHDCSKVVAIAPPVDEPSSAASLLAAARTTPAELDADVPPSDVAAGIEAIAEATDEQPR